VSWLATHSSEVAALHQFLKEHQNLGVPHDYTIPRNWSQSIEDRFMYLLCFYALQYEITPASLRSLLRVLKNRFEYRLWQLPVLEERELRLLMQKNSWKNWPLYQRFPGIIWAIGHWYRQQDKSLFKTSEGIVHLVNAIPETLKMPGLKRVESNWYLKLRDRCYTPDSWGLALPITQSFRQAIYPGVVRWLMRVGPLDEVRWKSWSSDQRKEYINKFYQSIDSSFAPQNAVILDIFRQKNSNDYLCQERIECRKCPFEKWCMPQKNFSA
jgi:hypothetical protein